jgi:hypothetical protein
MTVIMPLAIGPALEHRLCHTCHRFRHRERAPARTEPFMHPVAPAHPWPYCPKLS